MISILKTNKKLERIFVIFFWLAVWQIASLAIHQDLLLVSPVTVLSTLFSLIGQAEFWATVLYSFSRIVAGFLLAVLIGTAFAMLSAASSMLRALLAPFFSVVKSIPVASFIILVLIWAGSGSLSIIISFLMVLPILYTNILEGILQTDRGLLEMAKVFRIPFLKRVGAIYVPDVMPYFSSASKVGLGLCWKSGIAAEVIGLPTGSIGEQLYQAKIFLSTGELFSWTIVIVLISYSFEKLFMYLLHRGEQTLRGGELL